MYDVFKGAFLAFYSFLKAQRSRGAMMQSWCSQDDDGKPASSNPRLSGWGIYGDDRARHTTCGSVLSKTKRDLMG